MRIASLVALLGMAVAQEAPVDLTAKNAAEIVGGVLFGILEVPGSHLDTCLADGRQLEQQVAAAVQDLESLTFDGVKRGLQEAGAAVKLIPGLVRDCADVKDDLAVIARMASVFEHPLSLIYHVGKALIVNGSDIFAKIQAAIAAYKAESFFEFGVNLGQALKEVFVETLSDTNGAMPPLKKASDEHAYEYLVGFLGTSGLDSEALYNSFDGKGAMLAGPIDAALNYFNGTESLNQTNSRFWMALHEVEHVLLEGGEMLMEAGVFTDTQLFEARQLMECLRQDLYVGQDHVLYGFEDALSARTANDYYTVGKDFAFAASVLCSGDVFLQ